MGDEVGALEEQEYVAEALTLQGTVEGNPVCVLSSEAHKQTHTHTKVFGSSQYFISNTLLSLNIKMSCFFFLLSNSEPEAVTIHNSLELAFRTI